MAGNAGYRTGCRPVTPNNNIMPLLQGCFTIKQRSMLINKMHSYLKMGKLLPGRKAKENILAARRSGCKPFLFLIPPEENRAYFILFHC